MLSPASYALQLETDDPSTNRNPIQRAAAMHRMSYHRGRLRGILNNAIQEDGKSGTAQHIVILAVTGQLINSSISMIWI